MRKFVFPLLVVFSVLWATEAARGQLAQDLVIPGGPVTAQSGSQLRAASGPVDVVVRLVDDPLAVASGANAKKSGGRLTPGQQRAYLTDLNQKQNAVMAQARGLGGQELGRVAKALNAVIVRIDAAQVPLLETLPGVRSVRALGRYEMDLSETVPYIGAAALQLEGITGAGVRVAVLDSGIDYTHKNLGGSGDLADYSFALDHATVPVPGLYPSAKVVGGYDFVGETWDGTATTPPLQPDPNPLDHSGHGTHVADIIGGRSTDGSHVGVAPGTQLYAVKVCSSVSTSCSAVALLEGMDFALDPNGDGDISDAVDVINMSLGNSYGQREDDLSEASANAVRMGVVVVASAGNSADRPYIVGSPSSTPEVISVAQTQVPSAKSIPLVINSPGSISGTYANTETVDWAPITAPVDGNVVYVGRGCNVDTPLASPAGAIALIDRGTCNISEKVLKASNEGAKGVLIGLVAAGDAVSFSNGGQCPVPPDGTCKPTLVIIQSYANLIKANLSAPVNVTISPSLAISLKQGVVGSSSRGPSMSYNAIKPDIGAPGASVSALFGTGSGQEAFSGTSGAAPMVSGSAALLVGLYPSRPPLEIRSLLMNTAETNIFTNPATQPGVLAPITRIGGGEVRVNLAAASHTAAWDADDPAASLSFGYNAIVADQTFKKDVVVRNYGSTTQTYSITPTFRYADDAASGAVAISAPGSITVGPNGTGTFKVMLKIAASKLPAWNLNGGSQGGNGPLLQTDEFDGYINLQSVSDTVHLPWQILPHKGAAVAPASGSITLGGSAKAVTLTNSGVVPGRVDVFSLTGTSPKIQKKYLPNPGDNFAIIDLKSVGVRMNGSAVQFAINTFGERAHPNYPAEFDVYIDANNDGTPDYVIYNAENGGFAATGQNLVYVANLATKTAVARYYADASLDSANIILTAAMSDLGLTAGSKFTFSVFAFDNYFTGNLTDAITGMTYTAGTPKFVGSGIPDAGVPAGGSSTLTISPVPGGQTASPSQSGLLLMYRDAKPKAEADTISVNP